MIEPDLETNGSNPQQQSPGADQTIGPNNTPASAEANLDAKLRELERQAAEEHEAWLRAKAEAENVRKRAQADVAAAHKFAVERFAGDLLAVKDSLEAALKTEDASPEALRSGVELTLKQLNAAFEKAQLREHAPLGDKFDPHRHQAVSTVVSEQAPNTVVSVLQKGYLLSDRVIRPALVTVAQPKENAPGEAVETKQN